jgi:hypothetical protein
VFQYQGDANTGSMGSFRRYPDGSSVVDWGMSNSTGNPAFTEVDASGNPLLEMLWESHGNWAYRAVKVPLETFDHAVLQNAAGLP